jgi:hypothetical protein
VVGLLQCDNIADSFLFLLHHQGCYWIIEQSEETGNVSDKLAKGNKQFCSSFA